jgi:hypothetical protein
MLSPVSRIAMFRFDASTFPVASAEPAQTAQPVDSALLLFGTNNEDQGAALACRASSGNTSKWMSACRRISAAAGAATVPP